MIEADLAIELERLNVLDKCQLPLLGYLVGAIAEPEKIRLHAFRRCDANRENYYVFSPDGYVYPCMELLGQCQYAMFQYFPTFGIVCGNEPYVYSNILHAENRVECKDCIFTNELGVIHGTPIASEMKSSGLLFPKKMCRATPEEQEILDHYHPMYSYSFVDPHVDCFITNNRYWTNIVARIIENISDAEIYSRGFRRFCFRLFTLSIRAAKEKDIIFDDLSTEIESYCTFKGISF